MWRWLFILLFCGICTSCATVFTGTSQWMQIESKPSGAQIWINGKNKGTTPALVKIPRKIFKNPSIVLEKDSFMDKTLIPEKQLNRAAYLNTILVHCWLIDLASGALVQYPPFDTAILKPRKFEPGN